MFRVADRDSMNLLIWAECALSPIRAKHKYGKTYDYPETSVILGHLAAPLIWC